MAALTGRIPPGHRALRGQPLAHGEDLARAIAALNALSATPMAPYQAEAARVQPSTGSDPRTAEPLLADLGVDMPVFPSHRHCASWVGLCPGNHESAGTRKPGKTRQGNTWRRSARVAAWATRHPRTYRGAQSHRLARRRGTKKAIVAVAPSLRVMASHSLTEGTVYRALGHDSFDKRDPVRLQRRRITRLASPGLRVTVEPLAHAA